MAIWLRGFEWAGSPISFDFLHMNQIGERVSVQHAEERVQSFSEDAAQRAHGKNPARVCLEIEALHDSEVRFRLPHNFADIDGRRIARQRDPATAARGGVYERVRLQGLNHPDQMVPRNSVRLADLARGHGAFPVLRQIQQYPEGIIRMKREIQLRSLQYSGRFGFVSTRISRIACRSASESRAKVLLWSLPVSTS